MFALPRRAVVFPILAATLMSFMALRAAHAETQNRDVPSFQEIVLEGSGRLEITTGKAHAVVLDGEKETLDQVKTEVRNGKLYIGRKSKSFWSFDFSNRSFTARVALPQLEGASIMGSGLITATGLDGGDTHFTIDGSGKIEAAGRVKSLRLVINGSADADLPDLAAETAKVIINGSGRIMINAEKDLDVAVNGTGKVTYLGSPAQVSQKINGSGSIRKRD